MFNDVNPTAAPETSQSDLLFPMPSKEDIQKYGLYYWVLSPQERVFYAMARECEGLQAEIQLLQAKLQYIQFCFPDNLPLLSRAMALLERLQKTQKVIFKKDEASQLERAVENVFGKLNIPLALMRDGLPDPAPAGA